MKTAIMVISSLQVTSKGPDMKETKPKIQTWTLYWSPEGRPIATVQARTEREAIRKAPMPYRKYLGEMYAEVR
jgi:hypothetical protein